MPRIPRMVIDDETTVYRTRYFTDSGVIGSKDFVSKTYTRFKHHFNSKNEKNQNQSRDYPAFIL